MLSELRTVLDNLEERQYNEDFYAIWNCVLGISKDFLSLCTINKSSIHFIS